jgi:hypothetical protein
MIAGHHSIGWNQLGNLAVRPDGLRFDLRYGLDLERTWRDLPKRDRAET